MDTQKDTENTNSQQRWSNTAIIGFILSILWIYGFGSLIAVILGTISIIKINKNSDTVKGKGFAIAGIILGGLGLILPLWILTSVIWTMIARL